MTKKFMDYYNNDPEYRERHLQKLKEKIECDCGEMVSRASMARHRRTTKHQNKINDITNDKVLELEMRVQDLEKKVRRLKKKIMLKSYKK